MVIPNQTGKHGIQKRFRNYMSETKQIQKNDEIKIVTLLSLIIWRY